MSNKLYVGNLGFQTTSEDLATLFEGAGKVLRAIVVTDRDTRRSRGFGFVEMAGPTEALKAIALYNGHQLGDRALAVSVAHEAGAPTDNRSREASTQEQPRFREVKHKRRGGAQRRF